MTIPYWLGAMLLTWFGLGFVANIINATIYCIEGEGTKVAVATLDAIIDLVVVVTLIRYL